MSVIIKGNYIVSLASHHFAVQPTVGAVSTSRHSFVSILSSSDFSY